MNINFNQILMPLITSILIGIFGVAWTTYNQFVVMIAKFDYVVQNIEKMNDNQKEIFIRLNDIDKKIAKLEGN